MTSFFYRKVRDVLLKYIGPVLCRFEPPLLRTVSWGDNHRDKHFLVIRRSDKCPGLFSFVTTTLGWINYAVEHNMIPVVDMYTHKNLYSESILKKRSNVWELFFEQPSNFSLEDVRHAHNVTIAYGVSDTIGCFPENFLLRIDSDVRLLSDWRILASKYIRIKEYVKKKWACERLECALQSGVIGVLARGTDYVRMKPSNHPVQPSIIDVIKKVRIKAAENNFPIFLVTEDSDIEQRFKEEFKERLILSGQNTIPYSGGFLAECSSVRRNIDRAMLYLNAIYYLSKCQCIITGNVNGAIGAVLMANDVQDRFVFNLGRY